MRTLRLGLLGVVLFSVTAMGDDKPDLDWLAGAWCGGEHGVSIEEHWLPERGGLMLGVSRTVSTRRTDFEFLRIEFTSAGARYVAQPGGKPPTRFELVHSAPNEATFANPQHDFPKRVRYVRNGDSLTARVDGGSDDSDAEEYKWRRCPQGKPVGR
ncbi:MAG: DUF6265 family protein [Steroidobacter sp.]